MYWRSISDLASICNTLWSLYMCIFRVRCVFGWSPELSNNLLYCYMRALGILQTLLWTLTHIVFWINTSVSLHHAIHSFCHHNQLVVRTFSVKRLLDTIFFSWNNNTVNNTNIEDLCCFYNCSKSTWIVESEESKSDEYVPWDMIVQWRIITMR